MSHGERTIDIQLTEDEAMELLSRCMCSTAEDSDVSVRALRKLAKAIQLEDTPPLAA